ncbi:MAG: hypothetical protein WBV63_02335, partial [Candidatus Sulfotelmatobacter sp.]
MASIRPEGHTVARIRAPDLSREATAFISPARKCGVTKPSDSESLQGRHILPLAALSCRRIPK